MKMSLLEIVTNRPLVEDEIRCPYCQSEDLHKLGTETTLLGWVTGENPNHIWMRMKCKSCEQSFTRKKKQKAIWYTELTKTKGPTKVLSGLPGCFESYEYQCIKCNGPVVRKYINKKNKEEVTALSIEYKDGKPVKSYRTFFTCQCCGHGGETEEEYVLQK